MAQTFLVTNIQTGNFEGLIDFITEVNYKDTPLLTKSGRTKAKAINHEWMTQALKAGASNNRAEGYSPSFAASDITARARRANQCQILALPFSVSGTQDAVDKAGIGMNSEYEYQKDIKFKELALDIDFELIRSTIVTRDADAGTAGEMDGLAAWAGGNRLIAAGGAILTEDLYNQLCQILKEAGGSPDTVYCAGFQKRAITGWSTPIRQMDHKDKKLVNAVGSYDGDWGTQTIVWDNQMPTDELLVCEMKYINIAYLRPVEHFELGRTRDNRQGYVLSELTLEVKAPQTVGRFTGLATAA